MGERYQLSQVSLLVKFTYVLQVLWNASLAGCSSCIKKRMFVAGLNIGWGGQKGEALFSPFVGGGVSVTYITFANCFTVFWASQCSMYCSGF